VKAGQVLALLGPNGAGKTTTVRMLTSVLRPTRGWAKVNGHDVIQEPAKVRASVGVLTEHHGLYGRMPADEYLDFFGQIYAVPAGARRKRISHLINKFSLEDMRSRRIGEYSKGMRQKLALARALLHDPPVLLLDEPTSAMDPESARLVRDSIKALRSEDRAIVICTHNLGEAEELADQIAIIRQGKIIARGSPPKLKQILLGPEEYEVRFSDPLNGQVPELPGEAQITAQGSNWVRYKTDQPRVINPQILHKLISQGLPIVSLQAVARSLEQVYLRAVSTVDDKEVLDVK
jgi:ABC-2 type transport system ATP-binding protein